MQSGKGSIDLDPDGVRFFRTLMLSFFARKRSHKYPDAKLLAELYEETGDEFYYVALAHLIIDDLEKRLRAEREARP